MYFQNEQNLSWQHIVNSFETSKFIFECCKRKKDTKKIKRVRWMNEWIEPFWKGNIEHE